MNRFHDRLLQPFGGITKNLHFDGHRGQDRRAAPGEGSEFRQFMFQPIVGASRQAFGTEALFRAGWEDSSVIDVHTSSRIMIDNWLLFGFEEMSSGRPVFLKCTRNALLGGCLTLLPRVAVFEIQESVEPDDEILTVCRELKSAGYRLCLDDFESSEKMEAFLHLADFIKVDYRHRGRRQRASMFRRLRLTGASLIADKIECEEDFQQARADGYGLFQGLHLGECISFVKKRDSLDPIQCMRILEALQESPNVLEDLAESIGREPGIECRLLRRANWITPPSVVINSIHDAIEVVETSDIQKMITLAMATAAAAGPITASSAGTRNPLQRTVHLLTPANHAGLGNTWSFAMRPEGLL